MVYQIKVRSTCEGDFKDLGKAKDIKEAFKVLKQKDDIEEVYLKYFEREEELN